MYCSFHLMLRGPIQEPEAEGRGNALILNVDIIGATLHDPGLMQ